MSSSKEQALEAVIANLTVAAFLVQEGRIVGFNHAATKLVGESEQRSLAGQELLSCIAAVDQVTLSTALQRSAEYPVVVTLQLLRVDGKSTLTEFTLIGGWDGNPSLVLALAASPAEAPGALGRDWRFLRHVIDACPSMIFVKDRQGRFLLANRALAGAYDLPVAEVEGCLNASLHSNEEETEAFLRDDREVMDSRQSKLIVAEPVTYSDSSVHWYSTVKTPLLLDDVHCDHVLGIATNIDELKRVEEGLHHSEDLLSSVIDNSTAVIFVKDLDGRYLRVNQRYAELFHISDEEIRGRTDYDIFAPEVADALRVADRQVLAGGTTLEFEEAVPQDDGLHTYLVLKFPLLDASGHPYAVCGIATDISERKRDQHRLERLLAEQKAMLDNDLVGIVTVKGRMIVWANPAFETMLGYGPGELAGAPTRQTYPNEEAYLALGVAAYPALAAGKIFRAQTEHIRKDGRSIWVDISGSMLDPESGESLWGFVDITERKLAEDELRIAAIAFESQNGMIITDAQGVILRVNQAFTRLTGYSAAEAIGRTPAMLNSGRQDRTFFQNLWRSVEEQGYWQGEIWNKRKNGQIYAELLTITAVKAPEGGVTHYVGSFSDITVNKEAEAEIHRLAYYDPLTRLPNRRLFQDRLSHAIALSARSGLFGAIYFIDLDNFKALNDTRGHDIGDLLLVEVAQRLRGVVREMDTVARQGGDEFVILVEDLAAEASVASALAKQIGDKLAEAIDRPFNLNGYAYHCKVCIGVALLGERNTVEELFKHADLALYEAKSQGRNTLRFFDPVMQTALDQRSALENELRQALALQQLLLYYQPQVDAESRVTGAEVLLRWQHPERGLILPNDFIPLAEETGLIVPIGLWVLETACAQLQVWAARPEMAHLTLAVNVSARQFHHPGFVAQVQKVIEKTGADPQLLKLELTESLLLGDVEDTIAKMTALKAEGVGFSLDDFGTGYSSLSYLKRLPLDQLKIDRSFVRDILTDANDATIAHTIVTLGHSMGLTVIAEGVETEEQRDFLADRDCHAYQGYLFGRPTPLDGFERAVAGYAMVSTSESV